MDEGGGAIRDSDMSEPPCEHEALDPIRGGSPPTRSLFARRGIRLRGRSIRQHAARGTIVNAGFSIVIAGITLLRGVALARFLTATDYGIWGILIASLGTLFTLKQIGVGDKYLQQEGEDDELAFQRAFSVECVVNAVFLVVLLAAIPAVAAIYGRSELILPGLSMALVLPALVLQSPTWIFFRQMRFAEQRALQVIDPIVGSITALVLALAGAGYWALMAGVLAGAWATGLATLHFSPYRLRFRFERETLRSYMRFSWPLFVQSVSGMVLVQVSLFFGTKVTGLAGAGAITLAANVSQFAERVDEIVSGTMYPVICAVQNRVDLLHESFVKSNRVALLWAVPFGVGLSLFATDLVHFGIGERWRAAVPLLVAFGLTAAVAQLGFNWDDYYRARDETRPIAWTALFGSVAFVAAVIPLTYAWGLKGFAVAVGVQVLTTVACRVFFLRRLFDGFRMLSHAARACAPTVPAVLVLLLTRALEPSGRRTLVEVLVELALYLVVTAVATWALEGSLLREMVGYLRKSQANDAEDAPAPDEHPGVEPGEIVPAVGTTP